MKVNFSDCVSKAVSGDADAFAKLYSLVYKDLYHIALCNLRNSHDAADAVSDTVLDAFASISKLKDETAFKAWIVKILTVKIKKKQAEYINNRNNTVEMPDESEQKDKRDSFSGLEIAEQINSLGESERLVFSLSIVCGYSGDEISKMTGINPSTVRSHLHRARERLKERLNV
ncbi:MAG: sigma-70 family RNA polymerase sigma factor [Oscillospiraceae bacterium]|jgi:RNA polymerase sigma-70 factor (ECF subfamily)